MDSRFAHIRGGTARVNGVRLHYLEAGDGPLVVLLHGFPDFSWVWRLQLGPLAEEGFRVVAPDLRGFGRSDKPRGVRSYDPDVVADDVAALGDALGAGRPRAVVGHDMGGVVTWHLAARHPHATPRIAVLNAPHPSTWPHVLRSSDQLLRSAYVAFFQLPVLPELVLSAGGGAIPLRAVRRGVRRAGAVLPDDVARHRAALTEPRALHSALHYYRALGRRVLRRGRSPRLPRIDLPTLVVWGERDPFLSTRFLDALPRHVSDLRLLRVPTAGHWVQLDVPELVNSALVRWLAEGEAGSSAPGARRE